MSLKILILNAVTGAFVPLELQKRAEPGKGFICPGRSWDNVTCGKEVGALACPHCSADCPMPYCPYCGTSIGAYQCVCGQASPSYIAAEQAAAAGAVEVARSAPEDSESTRVELNTDGFVEQFRKEDKAWIVRGYLTGEVPDKHYSLPETDGLLQFAPAAAFDVEHSKSGIKGVSCRRSTPVRRRVNGKLVKAAEIEVAHDPSVPEARALYEAAERGDYTGFSAYFYIPAALDTQIKAAAARGQVTSIPAASVHSMPFISYVKRPSCPIALIESFRSAPDEPEAPPVDADKQDPPAPPAPALDAVGTKFDNLVTSAANAPEPAAPEAPAAPAAPEDSEPVQQLRSELNAVIEQIRTGDQSVLRDVTVFLDAKVAPAIDAAIAGARKGDDATLTAAKRYLDDELAKLRVAPPTHEPARPDASQAVMRSEEPTPKTTKFGEIPAGGSFRR